MDINYLKNNFDKISKLSEFDNHYSVIYINEPNSNLRGFIAIHRKKKNIPSFGATRFWHYSNEKNALKDALRLSKMMSYKSALAGLKYGGAKGVIIAPKNNYNKEKILTAYTKKINELRGKFITGTDVGLTLNDIKLMRKNCPYLVGFNGDPTEFTALGLYHSIQSALQKVFKQKSLKGRSFAIQGMGKIGSELLRLIYKDASKIFISDVNKSLIKSIKKEFPKVKIINPNKIHKQIVDVFSPCALSNSLNNKTLADLKCKIIVGGANNQLANENIGKLLYKKGILYAPDYVVNAGGLISVADEYENKKYNKQHIVKKIKKIEKNLNIILNRSIKEKKSTNILANEIADKVINQ